MELLYVPLVVANGIWAMSFIPATLFWLALIAICLCSTEELDTTVFGLFVSVVSLVALTIAFGNPSQVMSYIVSHTFGWFLAEYAVVGVLWMCLRWYMLSVDIAKSVRDGMDDLLKEYNNGNSYSRGITFGEWLEDRGYIPTVKSNKYRLAVWLLLWPFNMVRWSLTDMVRYVAERLVDIFGDMFTKMRNAIFARFGVTAEVLNQRVKPDPIHPEDNTFNFKDRR